MISSRTSCESARAIETTCCAAGRSALTFARGEMRSWPSRASSAAVSLRMRSRSRNGPRRGSCAEEDALGDGQVLDEVELLVDRGDAAA